MNWAEACVYDLEIWMNELGWSVFVWPRRRSQAKVVHSIFKALIVDRSDAETQDSDVPVWPGEKSKGKESAHHYSVTTKAVMLVWCKGLRLWQGWAEFTPESKIGYESTSHDLTYNSFTQRPLTRTENSFWEHRARLDSWLLFPEVARLVLMIISRTWGQSDNDDIDDDHEDHVAQKGNDINSVSTLSASDMTSLVGGPYMQSQWYRNIRYFDLLHSIPPCARQVHTDKIFPSFKFRRATARVNRWQLCCTWSKPLKRDQGSSIHAATCMHSWQHGKPSEHTYRGDTLAVALICLSTRAWMAASLRKKQMWAPSRGFLRQ